MRRTTKILLLMCLPVISGCGSQYEAKMNLSSFNEDLGSIGNPSIDPLPVPDSGAEPSADLGICGPLDFKGLDFPSVLSQVEAKSLALGLSVTGSFEGRQNWNNIGNNFDGQGMSLGLMQQNFGQGSLQPLLLAMRTQQSKIYSAFFSSANLSSLNQMLTTWDQNSLALASFDDGPDELFPERESLSPLDIGPEDFSESFQTLGTAANNSSVAWSTRTIYSGSNFKSDWKSSFQNLANSAVYRNLQLGAALTMFRKAQAYAKSFSLNEMRMVLLMYDFVVQNGGFNSTHIAKYRAYEKANPQASQTARALKLLDIRLVSVRDQYREDVRVRKTTIIEGTGTVHQSRRNLPSEYCFNPNERAL